MGISHYDYWRLNHHSFIPPAFVGARLSDFGPDVVNQLAPFLEGRRPWVFICGATGVGKTHMAAALYKVIFRFDTDVQFYTDDFKGRSAFFISPTEMFSRIKATYGGKSDESEEEVIRDYKRESPMVIDDLGAEYATTHTGPIMEDIINSRYNNKAITIITSNLSIQKLSEKYSDRMSSRIRGRAVPVILGGKDRRL